MRLGIFGGTFNPIHLGHLLLAETARETLALDRVLFIPVGSPPHKRSRDLAPGTVRMALIELAIRNHPAFAASDIELARPGPSYSIETARILRRQFPAAKLFLLVGEDMLAVRWVAWEELRRLCTIAAARRPGSLRPASARPHTKPFGVGARGVRWLPMPPVAIASSDIRKRLAASRSIRYLVPGAVERYLHQHQLYRRGAPTTRRDHP